MRQSIQRAALLSVVAVLAACGGGGGGGASSLVASTNAFNILSGWQALSAAGWTKTFAISGTCGGSATITNSAINTSSTFEGLAALSGTSVVNMSLTGCTPSSISSTETRYTDSNYIPRGYNVQGGVYGVYSTTPSIPSSVHVGDTGIVGSVNRYTDSTKSTSAGRQDVSYVIEADTSTTAILNVISKIYNASSVLQVTEQDRYRVAANGALTPLSMDVQYANGTHLVGQ